MTDRKYTTNDMRALMKSPRWSEFDKAYTDLNPGLVITDFLRWVDGQNAPALARQDAGFNWEGGTTEEHEKRITRCKAEGCNAQIIWLKTARGKNMPVDADTVAPGEIEYDRQRHTSHFDTCKRADKFRSNKQQGYQRGARR